MPTPMDARPSDPISAKGPSPEKREQGTLQVGDGFAPRAHETHSPPSASQEAAAEPSPPVTPIYLRQARKTSGAVPVSASRAEGLPDQNQALADALTRSLAGLLARALPEAVAAAVRSLPPEAPRPPAAPEAAQAAMDAPAAAGPAKPADGARA